MRYYLAALLLFSLLTSGESAGTKKELQEAAISAVIAERQTEVLEVKSPPADSPPEVLKAYHDALIGYLEYRKSGYQHRRAVYRWQFVSTIVTFFTVVTVVFTGLYFSYLQFTDGGKRWGRKRKTNEAAALDPTIQATTFKANLSGVEVSSNVIGLIILVVSIVFFYLYLAYVYPITDSI